MTCCAALGLNGVPESDCKDATGYGDEGNFAEVSPECGQEFLGELDKRPVVISLKCIFV